MSRKFLIRALVVGVAFILWTAVVHTGISHGSRHSVWIQEDFGTWPTTVDETDGTSDIELSIFASFAPGSTGVGPNGSSSNLVGWAAIGTTVDSNDSNSINGSRVTAPIGAGAVTAMSVYVASPVDAAPFDEFQLAIYTDDDGAPDRLLATSDKGHLVGDAWNSVPIVADLQPGAAYWLLFNTNGRSANVNNPTFRKVTGNPLDTVVQAQDFSRWHSLSSRVTSLGNMLLMTVAIGVIALIGWRRRRRQVIAMVAGYVAMLAIGLLVREWLFAPFFAYPSGHAMRTVYVALAAAWIVRRRWVTVLAGLAAVGVCLAAVYERGHYSEEIIGGVLLAWSMVLLARGLTDRDAPAAEQVADPTMTTERADESVNA